MKTEISHLSPQKQTELSRLVSIIKQFLHPEFIILFGSYARGTQVEHHEHQEGHITHVYESDFDILVIIKNEKLVDNYTILRQIESQLQKEIPTRVGLIIESLDFVNTKISEGRYFYKDILEEGIVLFDSKKVKLTTPKNLSNNEKKQMAEEDFDNWFGKVVGFFKVYNFCLQENELSLAAFNLHQMAESLFSAFLLVFTGYRPRFHDLEKLHQQSALFSNEIKNFFPLQTDEDKRLYDLLKKAYKDARYKKDYEIKKEELEELMKRVERLKEIVEKECWEKMGSF